ncbi:LysR family transcriptional regulator [Gordonia neofelifaecis]|uniref:LysR family transcriptional regulator n=1 Tax=Gordonia neofelifaecis NRRL B-59395 TaxID=644548 RepID=F1YPM7_9ACTN|nr:LysR family transcriptional regulator [Gordonia neofelifaecis]EGD53372.1 LysR family transcriptional regulator [Gordonia neofelifaecis NRRL B-59395]
MELRHLRYFRVVAEELHFRRAAERLHIAQPPLSAQIRQLEEELGVELLARSTRRVELTPAGRVYLDRVREILDAVDVAGEQAQRVADGLEGTLSIGCVGSATYSLFPRLVRALRDELPGVDVSVRGEMLAPDQLTALEAGEIQLALLRPPVTSSRVVVESVRHDRLIALVPDSHPLAGRRELDITDLRDDEFVMHAGHGRSVINGLVSRMCAEAGFAPRIRHEVTETSTLVTLVAAGLGVSVVPEPTSALDIAGVRYLPVQPEIGIDLAAAWIPDPAAPVVEQALQVLRRIAAE